MLTDGRPLPASSERLNERGAVIAQLPTLLPEERGRPRGGQREQELDGEPATDDVLKWEKMSEKGAGLETERRERVMEERRSVLGAAHLTPLSQKALQRGSLHYVKGGEQVVPRSTQSLYDACDQQSCWAVRIHG